MGATEAMTTQTRAEWLGEAVRRFGQNPQGWRFVCPACGNVQTPAAFKAIGVDPRRAYQECIGRYLPADQARSGLDSGGEGPCDWTAFGLYGTLGKGRLVYTNEHTHEVFDFYGEQ